MGVCGDQWGRICKILWLKLCKTPQAETLAEMLSPSVSLLQVSGCWQVSTLMTAREAVPWESPWGAWLWECWVRGFWPQMQDREGGVLQTLCRWLQEAGVSKVMEDTRFLLSVLNPPKILSRNYEITPLTKLNSP